MREQACHTYRCLRLRSVCGFDGLDPVARSRELVEDVAPETAEGLEADSDELD